VATACIATKALPCAVDFYITLPARHDRRRAAHGGRRPDDPHPGAAQCALGRWRATQLAVSPNNQLLYATDANLPGDKIAELVRIDIGSGAISRLKLSPPAVSSGAPITREQKALGGAIEVSGDAGFSSWRGPVFKTSSFSTARILSRPSSLMPTPTQLSRAAAMRAGTTQIAPSCLSLLAGGSVQMTQYG